MNRKKLYYIPGMITLVSLPFLGYNYLSKHHKQERSIECAFFCKPVNTGIKDIKKRDISCYDTSVLSLAENKRKYTKIIINGNTEEDNIKLKFFDIFLKDIFKKHDTINGIHLLFTDSAKYESFIKAINYCMIDSIIHYNAYDIHFWALYKKGDEIIKREFARRQKEDNNSNKSHQEFDKKTNSIVSILPAIKIMWPILPLYLILIYLSIIKIKKHSSQHGASGIARGMEVNEGLKF